METAENGFRRLVNLEWLPQSPNASKSDSITDRALSYAQKYFNAGLLSFEDLKAVHDARKFSRFPLFMLLNPIAKRQNIPETVKW